ncbi:SH3 domain-containing protein [candidate division WOR-3 bacterium]|uniref:SH3 domain-containing protein n=1 Tax=candidate division WOR-3 bacterium TaxID=2052148 RepID=A0A938BTL3_UNCW3|nr:SH3 domain-containing protein [candidate division WOR-3 bacterium]
MTGLVGALVTLVALVVEGVPAASAPVLRAWVIDDSSLIYEKPDPFSSTMRIVEHGDALRVLDRSPGWYEVLLPDNRSGWMVAQRAILSSRPGPGPGRVTGSKREMWAAFGGALAGGLVGIIPMGVFIAYTLGSLDPFSPVRGSNGVSGITISTAFGAWVASVVLVGPAAAAYGTFRAGESERPGGNLRMAWGASVVGHIAGTTVGLCLDLLLSQISPSSVFPFSAIGSLAGTTAGAVIGYERSKPTYARYYARGRVGLPAVGFSLQRDSSRQVSPAVRLDLVSVRF